MTAGHPEAPARTIPASGPQIWLLVAGSGFILLGGLVAAITGPLDWRRGSWLAAYMVLVCGVAQYVMGRAPAWFGRPTTARLGWTQVIGWNVGNVVVMAGTLGGLPNLVDVGGVVLFVILVDMLRSTRRTALPPDRRPGDASRIARWGWPAYRALLVLLVVSIPVGLVLAHLRVD